VFYTSTLHGEKCVIRILPHENNFSTLIESWNAKGRLATYEEWLSRSQGMILITGPTVPVKQVFIYSLAKLVDTTKNVVL